MSDDEGYRWSDAEMRIASDIRREFGSLWGDHDTAEGTLLRDQAYSKRSLIIQRFTATLPPRNERGCVYAQPYSLGLHLRALRDAAERGLLQRNAPEPDMEF